MRQSRDKDKWDIRHSMKTNKRTNPKQETKTMRNTDEIYNVNDFSSNNNIIHHTPHTTVT